MFDFLISKKQIIEEQFGGELEWERMDDKVTCRIKCQKDNVSVFNTENHKTMIEFLCKSVPKFHQAFEVPILELKRHLP